MHILVHCGPADCFAEESWIIRPVAVGDTLRRLAAKCLLGVVIPSASTYLLPLQVGVQVPNAAERVARHVSIWARTRAEDEIILQVDMRNAFNSIDGRRC